METIRALIIVVLAALVGPFTAGAQVWIEGQYNYLIYSDNNIDKPGSQIKSAAGYRWAYLWGALEATNSVDWGGQDGPTYRLGSVGAGVRIPIVKYLSAYGEFGYFMFTDQDDGWYSHGSGNQWESIALGLNKSVGATPERQFDNYMTHLDNAWGGQVGAVIDYPIYAGLSATVNAGYRFLQVQRFTKATWNDRSDAWWETRDQQDLGAWIMGIGLKYEF